jgi:hypothetical protein
MKTQVPCLILVLMLVPAAVGQTTDKTIKELDEKLKVVKEKIDTIKKRQAAELLDLERQAAFLEEKQKVRRGELRQKQRAREDAQKKVEEALNKKRYIKVEMRGKAIYTPQPPPFAAHSIPYQLAVGEQKFTLQLGTNDEAAGVFIRHAGQEVIVTGTLVKLPPPPAPVFPSVDPPPFPLPAGFHPGANPQHMNDYARRKASYDQVVKAWKILDTLIRESLGPGYQSLPMEVRRELIRRFHNDYAITVTSVKPAGK